MLKNNIIADFEIDIANSIVDLIHYNLLNQSFRVDTRKLIDKLYSWNIIGKKISEILNAI
jgi:hypothetical protein